MEKTCCHSGKEPQSQLKDKIILYRPLIIMSLISLFAAYASSYTGSILFMDALMGFFLIFLAALQLFNLNGFAKTLRQYDPVAKYIPPYAYAYPFIELALAGLYFSGLFPFYTNALMLIVIGLNTIGVIAVLISGRSVQCGCIGTTFNLPVGRVTLFENLVMGGMAAFNLGTILM